MKKITIIILLLIVVLVIVCCAPVETSKVYVKGGKTYGVTRGSFRGKWWNHYERGISYGNGAYWNEALADFQKAIGQRADDQRRARTYGMHFIDYFPHRELGIVFFNMGDFRGAVRELELSLSTEKSAKAKFYLNKARKSFLLTQVKDNTPPKIRTDSPLNNVITDKFFMSLSGVVIDDNYVSSIMINGVPQFIELSQKQVHFEKKIPVLQGSNKILIEVADLLGNRARQTFNVIGDFNGPQLSVINFISGQTVKKQKVDIDISFFDASGIEYVTVQDMRVSPKGGKSGRLSYTISLKQGKNTIFMEAADRAGNHTRGSIDLIYHPGTYVALNQRVDAFYSEMPHAFLLSDMTHLPGSFTIADVAYNRHGRTNVLIPSTTKIESFMNTSSYKDFLVNLSRFPSDVSVATMAVSDTFPPEIHMRGLLKNTRNDERLTMIGRRINNRFFIEGQAADPNGVGSVTINDRPVLSQPGKEVLFNRLIELDEGDNSFEIKATDLKGNTDTKAFYIKRRIQKIDLNGSRMTLSVMPFKNDCISPAFADSVYNLFVDEVISNERFNVVGRGVELEAILKELKLSRTDLVDKDKAVKTGRLMGSEAIMLGTIIEQQDSIEVFAKLIDTETSVIMASHDVFDLSKKRTNLEFLMEGLASKFVYSVPLIEGKIMAIKGDKFYLDISKERHLNIRPGIKCLAYRTEPFIVDDVVLGEETNILGNLILFDVKEKFSIAKFSEMNDQYQGGVVDIKKEDKVITK